MADNYYIGEYESLRNGYRFKVWDKQAQEYLDREYPEDFSPPEPIVLGTWLDKLPPEHPPAPEPIKEPKPISVVAPKATTKVETKSTAEALKT